MAPSLTLGGCLLVDSWKSIFSLWQPYSRLLLANILSIILLSKIKVSISALMLCYSDVNVSYVFRVVSHINLTARQCPGPISSTCWKRTERDCQLLTTASVKPHWNKWAGIFPMVVFINISSNRCSLTLPKTRYLKNNFFNFLFSLHTVFKCMTT